MQIDEGTLNLGVFEQINHYFGHYHTAGNRRNELDENTGNSTITPIMQAIVWKFRI